MIFKRVISWFSCGVCSAVASKLAIEKYGDSCKVVYCNTMSSEHPDNARFLKDCESWFGRKIEIIGNKDYSSIDDVFEKTNYMAGVNGARCTVELKKKPRFQFQRADDIHVFGFSGDELSRINRFKLNNPELNVDFNLYSQGITRDLCDKMINDAGIESPVMYRLGFNNNNCIGCVKASSIVYWCKIRELFPHVFDRRAAQSRKIGCRLTRLHGKRIFLDEIPKDYTPKGKMKQQISCGVDCGQKGNI